MCVLCTTFFLNCFSYFINQKKQLHEWIFRGSGWVLGIKIKTEIDCKHVYGLNSILLQLAGEK